MNTRNQKTFVLRILLAVLVMVICTESAWAIAGVWRRHARRAAVVVTASAASASAASASQQTAAANQSAASANAAAASANQAAASANQAAAAATQPAPAAARPAGAPPLGAVVSALPAGCVTKPMNGVEYYDCAGVFYRSTFQGNTLVYVVVQQP